MSKWRALCCLGSTILWISCAAHAPSRGVRGEPAIVETSIAALTAPGPAAQRERLEVRGSTIEKHPKFTLAVIEFDDQGELWSIDAYQTVIKELQRSYAGSGVRGVQVIVFAHGWKHSARVCDENLSCFRAFLESAADAEPRQEPRPVWGIYLAWRGLSIKTPGLKELSFWTRKNTSERVGRNDVTDVLSKLDAMHRQKLAEPESRTRMTVIGHSFGAGLVFSAYGAVLRQRLAAFDAARGETLSGCGSLLVLINPAFESTLYRGIHQLAANVRRGPRQPEVMLTIGSEGDSATRRFFRVGRWFSTLFQRFANAEERRRARRTIPNDSQFVTHRLNTTETGELSLGRTDGPCSCPFNLDVLRQPGTDPTLTPLDPAMPQASSPFKVATVSRSVLEGHGDVFNPRLMRFLLRYMENVDRTLLLPPTNFRIIPGP
jgi:pimeloyl-ACP methyl ester carboxylesterase